MKVKDEFTRNDSKKTKFITPKSKTNLQIRKGHTKQSVNI